VNRQKRQHLRIDRKHNRIDVDIPCKVGPSNSRLSSAQVLDISIGGLKFSCNQATIRQIIPDSQYTVGLISGVEIVVHFTIEPHDQSSFTIKTPARVIHTERLAQDKFHIGIQFLGLDSEQVLKLESWIDEIEAAAESADSTLGDSPGT
jgi:hypothetical protein